MKMGPARTEPAAGTLGPRCHPNLWPAFCFDHCAYGGGGGGFFLVCEDLGRIFDNSFPAYAFFFSPSRLRGFREFVRPFFPCLRFLLLVLVEIISHTLIPLLRQDRSTVAQRAKTTAAECSLMSCV